MIVPSGNEKNTEKLELEEKRNNLLHSVDKIRDILNSCVETPVSTVDLKSLNKVIDTLWRKGQHEQALEVLNKTKNKYPKHIDLEIKRGEILLDCGQNTEAIETFSWLNNAYPDNFYILFGLGDSFLQIKYYEEAEEFLLRALSIESWNPLDLMAKFEVMELLAKLYLAREECGKALEYLEPILMVQPRYQKWQIYFKILEKLGQNQKLEEAKITYEKIKKGRRYASRAMHYEGQGKLELALKNYRKAIEMNPFEPHYYFCVGSMLEKLPEDEYEYQFEEATAYYKSALDLFPNNFFYAMSYVGNLTNINQWPEAFEQAIEVAKKFPILMLPNLRYLSDMLGEESKYISLLREIIDLDPREELVEIRTELAVILRDLRNSEAQSWFEKTAELYGKKLEVEPYNWRHYFDFACCLIELENYVEARDNLIIALKYHGEFSMNIAEKLVFVLFKLEEFKDAKVLLEGLIVSNPYDYDYLGKIGMCFLVEQDYEKAFEAFNRSLLLDRFTPEYLYGAGVSAAHLNRTEDVINIVKDLLVINDDFIDVIESEPAFDKFRTHETFKQLMDEKKKLRNQNSENEEPEEPEYQEESQEVEESKETEEAEETETLTEPEDNTEMDKTEIIVEAVEAATGITEASELTEPEETQENIEQLKKFKKTEKRIERATSNLPSAIKPVVTLKKLNIPDAENEPE
jgi:tetratricopeptide (TPR) repeat protein